MAIEHDIRANAAQQNGQVVPGASPYETEAPLEQWQFPDFPSYFAARSAQIQRWRAADPTWHQRQFEQWLAEAEWDEEEETEEEREKWLEMTRRLVGDEYFEKEIKPYLPWEK